MSEREKRSFEILVRENTRMLTVFLRSRANDEAAVDDLFQETMLVAWKRLDDCDLSRPFGPWLRGIAHRLVMAHYRRQNRLPLALPDEVLELVDKHFENIQAQPGDTWDDKVAALHECLEALPENHRAVVQGRYLEDEPTKSVAERLGISLETCKKRLQSEKPNLLAFVLKENVWRNYRGKQREYVAEVRVKGGAVETVMLDLHDFKCVSDNAAPKDWKQVDQLAICAKYEIRSRKPGVKPKVIAANPWQGPKHAFKRLEWQLKD